MKLFTLVALLSIALLDSAAAQNNAPIERPSKGELSSVMSSLQQATKAYEDAFKQPHPKLDSDERDLAVIGATNKLLSEIVDHPDGVNSLKLVLLLSDVDDMARNASASAEQTVADMCLRGKSEYTVFLTQMSLASNRLNDESTQLLTTTLKFVGFEGKNRRSDMQELTRFMSAD